MTPPPMTPPERLRVADSTMPLAVPTFRNSRDLSGLQDPYYPAFDDWLADWFLSSIERRVAQGSQTGIYWCGKWWAHPEGLQRIYCLWREWEIARASENMSEWWRDHLDRHLDSLTAEHGPFARCSPARHYQPLHLASIEVPPHVANDLPEGHDRIDADKPAESATDNAAAGAASQTSGGDDDD